MFTLKDANGTSLSSGIVDRTELSKKGGWARFSVTREPARIPQPWDGLELSAGHAHSLILKPDGTLSGMGANLSGQLGLADGNDSLTPSPIDSAGVTQVSAGGHHSLYIKQDGSAGGWEAVAKPLLLCSGDTQTHRTWGSFLDIRFLSYFGWEFTSCYSRNRRPWTQDAFGICKQKHKPIR